MKLYFSLHQSVVDNQLCFCMVWNETFKTGKSHVGRLGTI